MNIELLREVGRFIVEHPKNFSMYWQDGGEQGAIGCIAMWTCWLQGRDFIGWLRCEALARGLLGISGEQANRLFYVSGWTPSCTQAYGSTTQHSVDRALAANQAIEALILEGSK